MRGTRAGQSRPARQGAVNAGGPDVHTLDDWTVVTEDGSLSTHFEHTVAITDGSRSS
jgi:methionyl aminopeptidase